MNWPPGLSLRGVMWSDMNMWWMRGVSSHQRPWHWGILQVVKWKPWRRTRWWGDTFLGSLGKRGFASKPGVCRGALWTPAGAGRGVIVLHDCLFTMLTGLAYGAHPLHAASGCSSRVSSDSRLWGTSNPALINHNAGPQGALGKQTTSSPGSSSSSSTLNGWKGLERTEKLCKDLKWIEETRIKD